ncbi:hypothetical protein A4H97_08155 [Niastella yeongjuensis]|uniref:DUF4843 domain-containing protein n=1 Tax=Niastella yeongjuensis TaxID=354355 RepID=A0A1V9ENL4_9BACT|nr:DUF4843 domain-containing protein [Niastella yeongjuensis]OQP47455.1 hypothetical protein A4H97_08155 [Niastella yeongjuensis]SEN85096.1 protein of unknown function [Niastella yeongjuensis]
MNLFKYIVWGLVTVVVLDACKKESLLTYNASDNIYFYYKKSGLRLDSINFTFAYSPNSVRDSNVMVPFAVTGVPAKEDREFIITVDPSSSAQVGTHFLLPGKFVLGAGKLVDSFPVKLLRTPDLQKGTMFLKLNLQPNGKFQTNIQIIEGLLDSINPLTLKINVTDILGPGSYWAGIFQGYFGIFSVKKVNLLNQVTGMPIDITINGIYDLNLDAKCAYYAISMSRYLKDQTAAGQTVYEDDGTPMAMSANYQ